MMEGGGYPGASITRPRRPGKVGVFLSYAHEDRAKAKWLAGALENRGFRVWWDRNLVGGQAFRQEINDQITVTDCVVVLWSMSSIASKDDRNSHPKLCSSSSMSPHALTWRAPSSAPTTRRTSLRVHRHKVRRGVRGGCGSYSSIRSWKRPARARPAEISQKSSREQGHSWTKPAVSSA